MSTILLEAEELATRFILILSPSEYVYTLPALNIDIVSTTRCLIFLVSEAFRSSLRTLLVSNVLRVCPLNKGSAKPSSSSSNQNAEAYPSKMYDLLKFLLYNTCTYFAQLGKQVLTSLLENVSFIVGTIPFDPYAKSPVLKVVDFSTPLVLMLSS